MGDCTPEQSKLVAEILSIKRTDYYRVLKVERTANDVEIKKSYRKLAIKLHPDKNKHPKAAEAFKVIAKAFEVLGDESKRKIYDMTGSDPDSRGGGGGGGDAGFSGFNPAAGMNGFRGFPPGAGMGGGINEDLLNMLFGMGGMGGNGFSFQFGGNGFGNNGFYFPNDAGMNARRRAAQQQQQRQRAGRRANNANGANPSELPWSQYIVQFLPLLIILISIIINSLSGGSGESTPRNVRQFHGRVPKYDFHPIGGLDVERSTPKYNINYYVSEKTMEDFKGRKDAEKELSGLDKYVEGKYIEQLNYGCIRERNQQREMIESAQGIFYNDWDTIGKANNLPMPNCEQLKSLNLL